MPAPLLVQVPAEFAWVVERAIREAMAKIEVLKLEPPHSIARDWKYEGETATVCLLWPAPNEGMSDTQLREVA